jgi:myo-inositol-1(or 4)-monophosphatase
MGLWGVAVGRSLSDALSIAREAAQAAARIIGQSARPREISKKGVVDLVTEVDRAAEDAILDVLSRRSPQTPVLAEEGGGALEASTRWIVDPLDGTTNFVHGFPCYGPSIALQVDGDVVAACTLNIPRNECFEASSGGGAWCNGERLQVSGVRTLDNALLLTGFPYDRRQRAAFYLRFVKQFLERGQGLRRDGSATLDFAHIAAGRADGFWEFGLQPWDVAAGTLLVLEAGGTVSGIAGGRLEIDRPQVVASNGWIHDEMTQICANLLAEESEWASH